MSRVGSWLKAASTAVFVLGLMATSATAAILGLTSTGTVYKIDVGTGAASVYANVGDPSPQANQNFSPNSIANNGTSLFFTNYASTTTLYRNSNGAPAGNVTLGVITGSNIASGAAVGDSYYYMRDGVLRQVTGINSGSLSTASTTTLFAGGASYGDIEIRNGTAYISYTQSGAKFASFNLSGSLNFVSSAATRMYAGLAFSGSNLYGLTGAGMLYQLNLTGGQEGGAIQVRDSAGIAITNMTDATVIPLPAAALLLLCALGGLGYVSRRRNAAIA